ncbi:transcription factor 7-like [Maylandia zebra]
MLYLKEQRPKVIAELNIPGSAAGNAVVGQRWKSLSNDQKARYFKQAETERQNHAKEHPAWSTKENYPFSSRQRKPLSQTVRKNCCQCWKSSTPSPSLRSLSSPHPPLPLL